MCTLVKVNRAMSVFMFNASRVGNSSAYLVKHKRVSDDSCCKHAQVAGRQITPGVAKVCVVFSRRVAISHRRLLNP